MKRITYERERRKWSRAELGRRAQLNPATVGQIEASRLNPYPSQLQKLAAALGWVGEPAGLLEEAGDACAEEQ